MKFDVFLIQLESAVFLTSSIYNLGLLSIASVLQNSGYAVKALMTQNFRELSYAERINLFKESAPSIVGFNINSDNINNVAYMAEEIKKVLPSVYIVVGGPLASTLKEDILKKYDCFDFSSVGEGEFTILSLCRLLIGEKPTKDKTYHLETKQNSLEDISGLVYRKNGEIIYNPRIPFIEDLNILPPADYSMPDVITPFMYSSGRGCPFRCAFCSQDVHARGYRCFEPQRVVNDLMNGMKNRKTNSFEIVDDTFVAHQSRAEEICRLLKEKRKTTDFIFGCEGRIDTLYKNPELINTLYDAGLRMIQFGIENGNQKILDIYHKKITLEQVEKVVSNVYKHGNIVIMSNFILGGPMETQETLENTFEFSLKLLDSAPGFFELNVGFLCPYPGTEITLNAEKLGLKIIDDEWVKSITVDIPSCVTPTLDKNTLLFRKVNFLNSFVEKMVDICRMLPYEVIDFHFNAAKYGILTRHYSMVLSRIESINKWYKFRHFMNTVRLSEVSLKDIKNLKCLRTTKKILDNGNYNISGWFTDVIVSDPKEKFLYDLSSGKFTIREIANKFAKKFYISEHESISNYIIPFFEKLEKTFHIVFFR